MKQFKVKQMITLRSENIERYLKDINSYDILSSDEEIELATKIQNGDKESLDKLVLANLRFVVTVAKQYQGNGLDLSDLINEGNIGLITAAQKFDPTKGFKFISYAVWWIRQSILQALASDGRLVRLPLNKIGDISKINQTINRFIQDNQREPSIDELVELTCQSIEKVKDALYNSSKPISFDTPLDEDESSTFLDIKPDEGTPPPDKITNVQSLKTDLTDVFALLTEREQKIIRYFFGIECDELTLEEIGEELDLTRERVRQIKDEALNKLRNDRVRKILCQHLD